MSDSTDLPSRQQVKAQARALRVQNPELSHGHALEQIAQRYGHRNWNSFSAAITAADHQTYAEGDRITGRYLSQPFHATVLEVERLRPGWHRLTIDLDQAVDVVTFDGFSNFRKRIKGTVGPAGHSPEKTSDGQPHLIIR